MSAKSELSHSGSIRRIKNGGIKKTQKKIRRADESPSSCDLNSSRLRSPFHLERERERQRQGNRQELRQMEMGKRRSCAESVGLLRVVDARTALANWHHDIATRRDNRSALRAKGMGRSRFFLLFLEGRKMDIIRR